MNDVWPSTRLVGAAALFLLAACVTAPEQPAAKEIRVAAGYGQGDSQKNAPTDALIARDTPQLGVAAVSTSNVSAAADKWWQSFGDERLNRMVDRVLEVNTDLTSAGLRLQHARLEAGLATDALRPHVDASVSAGYDKPLKGSSPATHSYGAFASVGYELDLWGKLRSQREVANWEAQATAEDLQSTALALVGDTCSLYWTLAFLNQRIAAGEQSLDRLRRTLSLVQTQFTAGAVSGLEVHEAEQNIEDQLTAQSQLIQQRVDARNALIVLLDGHPWSQSDEPQDLNDARSPEIPAGIPAEILARRPDLRAAELRLRKLLASIHVTQTSYYPAISLTGTVGGSSTALGDALANPVATLGAGLALPFLHWNEMRVNARLAGTDYEIAASEFRKTLYIAFTDVDNALSARAELTKQLDSSQKSFDAAVEIDRLYEIRYRSGAAALRFWLDAQETRRSAELALAHAKLSQLQNDIVLFQALGGGS